MKTRYPGARPFSTDQKPIFFGREKELGELHRFVLAEQLVVLYSKSGLGKSSLLNAGLIPLVETEGRFLPVQIRFGAFTESNNKNPLNDCLNNLTGENKETIPALEKIKPQQENSLWYQLKTYQLSSGNNGFILVFDQFEELFTYPAAIISAFGQQISELLYLNIPDRFRKMMEDGLAQNETFLSDSDMRQLHQPFEVRVIMAIRSDRMSLMDKLSTFLPNILENCYELGALNIEDAESAILSPAYLPQAIGPFKSPVFDFEDESVASLIEFLSEDYSQEIESFQLQILCEYIEAQVVLKKNKTLVTTSDIVHPELILENYYLDKINELPPRFRLPARKLLEEGLVFEEEERRLTLYEGQITKAYNVTPELLRMLLDTHLVRSEPSLRGGYTYELSHDTLVAPVLRAKAKRKEAERQEAEKEAQRRREEELAQLRIEAEEERKRTQTEKQLRKEAQANESRAKQRTRYAVILSLIAISLAVVAIISYQLANEEKLKARKALNDFRLEQAAKKQLEFSGLEERANVILSAGGCPTEIINEMEEISNEYPDNDSLIEIIEDLKNAKTRNKCQ
ncbi:MAG: hypothetical protein AAFZ15_34535 [Bacteroidota bacterium]